jgi:hypothetical protein
MFLAGTCNLVPLNRQKDPGQKFSKVKLPYICAVRSVYILNFQNFYLYVKPHITLNPKTLNPTPAHEEHARCLDCMQTLNPNLNLI